MTFPVPGGATFLRARRNLADVASAATSLANIGGLGLVAATSVAGFALQNGTPTVISWTAPNDGQLHRATVLGSMDVTVAETGGNVGLNFTLPDGTTASWGLWTGGQASTGFNFSQGFHGVIVKAGTTVSIVQTTALTVGAATLWAEIWAL